MLSFEKRIKLPMLGNRSGSRPTATHARSYLADVNLKTFSPISSTPEILNLNDSLQAITLG